MLSNYTDERVNRMRNFYADPDMEIDEQTQLTRALSSGKLASDYEKKMLRWIVDAHRVISGKNIDLEKFSDLVSVLEQIKQDQTSDYYKALIHPERCKGVKIPSPIPIPSSSFQLKQSIWLTTNNLGNMAIAFNPWGLFTTNRSTLYINNDSTLTGTASNLQWRPVVIGQQLPQAIYTKYRVVSSAVAVRYVGRLDIVQGIIGGSIAFENLADGDPTSTSVPAGHPIAKYADFNVAIDAFYTQENLTLHGTRSIYFPMDNSFEQYIDVGLSKQGFANVFYISGGVSAANSYKLDICVNFECIPDSTFLNYMPSSTPGGAYNPIKMQDAIQQAQKKPVGKAEDLDRPTSILENIGSSVGGVVNSLADSVGKIIPGVKTLISLYGSLF